MTPVLPTRGEILTRVRGLGRYVEQRHGYVYFLTHIFGEVVYVGQALTLRTRIADHEKENIKSFTGVYAVRVPVNLMDAVEALFIAILGPKYNRKAPVAWGPQSYRYFVETYFDGDADFVDRCLFKLPREGFSPLVRCTVLPAPHIDTGRQRAGICNRLRDAVNNDMLVMRCRADISLRRRLASPEPSRRPSPPPARQRKAAQHG